MTIQKTTFANNPTPPLGGDYTDGNGNYMRVTMTTPQPIAGQPGCKQSWSQVWQVDANGNFVTDAHGNPIGLDSTPHTFVLSQVNTKQATIHPGWIKLRLTQTDPNTPDPANLPATWNGAPAKWTQGAADPTAAANPGKMGDYYLNTTDNSFWQWDNGLLHGVHQGRLPEMVNIIAAQGVTF